MHSCKWKTFKELMSECIVNKHFLLCNQSRPCLDLDVFKNDLCEFSRTHPLASTIKKCSSCRLLLTSLIYSNNDVANVKQSPSRGLAKNKRRFVRGKGRQTWLEMKWVGDRDRGRCVLGSSGHQEAVKYEAPKQSDREKCLSPFLLLTLITVNQLCVIKTSWWCMPHLVNAT